MKKQLLFIANYSLNDFKDMGWRLNYIAKQEEIEAKRFEEYERYSKDRAEQILNLTLKYNMTGGRNTVAHIVELMNELNRSEYETIIDLVNIIE